jgi:hypothetical protein
MDTYRRPTHTRDLRENRRVILAHGEATGHAHEVVLAIDPDHATLSPAEFFEEPTGRRVLLIDRPCQLRHEEHAAIALNPATHAQVRQGDVLLEPIGRGAWEVIRQREYAPRAVEHRSRRRFRYVRD